MDRDIAMVFQSCAPYPNMTVERNITFGLRARGVPREAREDALRKVTTILQIEPLLERRPAQRSGGQRQRLGTSAVYVTHDQIEAMTLATRIAVMRDVVLQPCADPRTVFESPANMFEADFMGSPPMNFVPATLVQQDSASESSRGMRTSPHAKPREKRRLR